MQKPYVTKFGPIYSLLDKALCVPNNYPSKSTTNTFLSPVQSNSPQPPNQPRQAFYGLLNRKVAFFSQFVHETLFK